MAEIKPEEETNTGYRFFMIGTDGVYRGLARGVSAFGLLVDAVNHSPRILNVIPGNNFGPMHPKPFLGSTQIYNAITGTHEAYKDLTGITVPEAVTIPEKLAASTGEAVGMAVVGLTAGPVIGAANTAIVGGEVAAVTVSTAPQISPLTRMFAAVAENPVAQSVGSALSWIGKGAANLSARFAIANPVITTGIIAGTDVALNDGRIVKPLAQSATNYVAESFGIGPIFRDSATPVSTEAPGLTNLYGMVQDPTKAAGMLAVVFAMNSLLNNYMGNFLGILASVAIAVALNEVIGKGAHAIVDTGKDLINAATGTPAEKPVVAPVPAPG